MKLKCSFKLAKSKSSKLSNLNYFICIDISEVNDAYIRKIGEWLDILGSSLLTISNK